MIYEERYNEIYVLIFFFPAEIQTQRNMSTANQDFHSRSYAEKQIEHETYSKATLLQGTTHLMKL